MTKTFLFVKGTVTQHTLDQLKKCWNDYEVTKQLNVESMVVPKDFELLVMRVNNNEITMTNSEGWSK